MNLSKKDASDLTAIWDKVMENNPEKPGQKLPGDDNPYLDKIEVEDSVVDTADTNLSTAFVLISTWGFSPDYFDKTDKGKKAIMFAEAGKVMAERSEARLPHTLSQLYKALAHSRESLNVPSQELVDQIRGMILMVYAWGYVIDRTTSLQVRDTSIYPSLAELSSTIPNSDERKKLTRSAENKLEQTTGLIIQAIDLAVRKNTKKIQLLMTGALQMLYALANVHYGIGASYTDSEPEVKKLILPGD
jgi:hypothetical protein